jgi:hypothetical protein
LRIRDRYRRNVGDTLINACYVLRDQFMENLLGDMRVQLAQTQNSERGNHHWEVLSFIFHMCHRKLMTYTIMKDIEATLFCIKSVHDALTTSNLQPLEYLFEESTMAALPQSGAHRVRWTMLTLIGTTVATNASSLLICCR